MGRPRGRLKSLVYKYWGEHSVKFCPVLEQAGIAPTSVVGGEDICVNCPLMDYGAEHCVFDEDFNEVDYQAVKEWLEVNEKVSNNIC